MNITKIRQSMIRDLEKDLQEIRDQIKTFKEPVDLIENLPIENNNDGDLRVCLEDGNIYTWNEEDSQWNLTSSKGGAFAKILTLKIQTDGQTQINTGIRFDKTGDLQTDSTIINLYLNGLLQKNESYSVEKINEELVITWIDSEPLCIDDEIGIQYYDILAGKKISTFNMISSKPSNIDLSNISNDILPNEGHLINIGSEEKPFKSIYVDEARISADTLYVNGVPVIGSTNEDIIIKADIDQGISVKTTGTGSSKVTSENKVEIISNGVNADVDIKAIGSDSKININGQSQINFTSNIINANGEVNVKDQLNTNNLTVKGDLIVQGTTTTVESQNLTVKDNIIEINKGQIGNGVSAGTAGLKIDRGDEIPYLIIFDEEDDKLKIGIQDELSEVPTTAYIDNEIDKRIQNKIDVDLTDQEIENMINEIFN